MPVYQYACADCSGELEVRQSFTDDSLTTCPTCEGRLRKILSAVGVVFKGSGFYRNDSRPTPAHDSDTSSSDGKADSKSDPKSVAKDGSSSKASETKESSSSGDTKKSRDGDSKKSSDSKRSSSDSSNTKKDKPSSDRSRVAG